MKSALSQPRPEPKTHHAWFLVYYVLQTNAGASNLCELLACHSINNNSGRIKNSIRPAHGRRKKGPETPIALHNSPSRSHSRDQGYARTSGHPRCIKNNCCAHSLHLIINLTRVRCNFTPRALVMDTPPAANDPSKLLIVCFEPHFILIAGFHTKKLLLSI